ncbi:MAG: phage tail protein [Alphaproteobacteria bacterium]|nr:phage tail protein [Alphaproteobacteria bacterium]
MLMSLGLYVFGMNTAPFETLKRSTQSRWESQNRVGKGPAKQFLGPGDDTITIDGALALDLTGGPENLDKLREMASSGKAWILTAGTGEVLDAWFITSVDETRSHMYANGRPRLIEFAIQLTRYWDDDTSALGRLMDSLP